MEAREESDIERLHRFKNGETYTADIKLTRNPKFHRKVMAFFGFCFSHWCADRAGLGSADETTQFNRFRKDLTILAGFYDTVTNIRGEVRAEAKSLSYPPTRARRDLDNLFKAPLDSLTSAGVIADDSLIDDVRMVRCEVVKGGRLEVIITELEEA